MTSEVKRARRYFSCVVLLFDFFLSWPRELTRNRDRTLSQRVWGEERRDHFGCRLRERFTLRLQHTSSELGVMHQTPI
jgi:hypothetical protein